MTTVHGLVHTFIGQRLVVQVKVMEISMHFSMMTGTERMNQTVMLICVQMTLVMVRFRFECEKYYKNFL